jgi:hypothetical protein
MRTNVMNKVLGTSDEREARALLDRWPPFTISEESLLDREIPGWRAQLREARERGAAPRGPARSPDELEDDRRMEAAFGEKVRKAEADLAAAIAATEAARESMFVAHDDLARVSSTTWLIDGQGNSYERRGGAEQGEAAIGRAEDAKREYERVGRNEQAAREKVTGLGDAVNAFRRQLGAARVAPATKR